MKMVVLMDRGSLLAILADEYGIKNPQELDDAIRRMKPLDLKPFCEISQKTKEEKET